MRASILSGQESRDQRCPPPIPMPDKFKIKIGNVVKKPFVPVLPNHIKSDVMPTPKPQTAIFGVNKVASLISKPFKVPTGCVITEKNLELRKIKSLGGSRANIKIVKPGDLSGLIKISGMVSMPVGDEDEPEEEQLPKANLPPFEPLVLWADPDDADNKIEVIPSLACKLRPHQREGVQFLFECTMGLRGFEGQGCILADDMGLGKTLMSIATMWTLLNQGFKKGEPAVRKVIIACPTSLVGNWDNEIRKWVGDHCPTFAVKTEAKKMIKTFLQHSKKGVLIISYDSQRLYSSLFDSHIRASSSVQIGGNCCDLLICDEAHKLKNAESEMAKCLNRLPAKKRILLSGTPMQNELTEFFNMVNFCNPGVLGTINEFRRKYERPILAAREPDALESEVAQASVLQTKLSTIVNEFILKRGNILNAQHLPPKLVQYICCRPTALQQELTNNLLNSKEIRQIKQGKSTNTLNVIRQLINICSHPKLIYDQYLKKKAEKEDMDEDLQVLGKILSAHFSTHTAKVATSKPVSRFGASRPPVTTLDSFVDPELSGKMLVLYKMMQTMRILKPQERIVVVSNYTSTLDLIEVLCKQSCWPVLRLDGTVNATRRTKLVEEFNSPQTNCFAFLLSSKAGGCGINLIGGNRLVLFDPDWNPASDKQAAGRIWREGQKRRCFIYRFMSTGMIEEKIIQRQLSKEGLVDIVEDKEQVTCISTAELKQLFNCRASDTLSDTHDTLRCTRCKSVANRTTSSNGKVMHSEQLAVCSRFWDGFVQQVMQESVAYQRREKKRAQFASGSHADQAIDLGEGVGDAVGISELDSSFPFQAHLDKLLAFLRVSEGVTLTMFSRKQREVVMEMEAELNAARASVKNDVSKDGKTITTDKSSKIRESDENVQNTVEEGRAEVDGSGINERMRQLASLFPPSFSLFSEFIRQWTELVPHLVTLTNKAPEAVRDGDGSSEGGAVRKSGGAISSDNDEGGEREEAAGVSAEPKESFAEQIGCPTDVDLLSFSHHPTVLTVDDDLLRSAFLDSQDALISFVFGLEVNFSMLEMREKEEKEKERNKKAVVKGGVGGGSVEGADDESGGLEDEDDGELVIVDTAATKSKGKSKKGRGKGEEPDNDRKASKRSSEDQAGGKKSGLKGDKVRLGDIFGESSEDDKGVRRAGAKGRSKRHLAELDGDSDGSDMWGGAGGSDSEMELGGGQKKKATKTTDGGKDKGEHAKKAISNKKLLLDLTSDDGESKGTSKSGSVIDARAKKAEANAMDRLEDDGKEDHHEDMPLTADRSMHTDDFQPLVKLLRKSALNLPKDGVEVGFAALWKLMKKNNNNWRVFRDESASKDGDDGDCEVYTRTPGCTIKNYKHSYKRWADYIVSRRLFIRYIVSQLGLFNDERLKSEIEEVLGECDSGLVMEGGDEASVEEEQASSDESEMEEGDSSSEEEAEEEDSSSQDSPIFSSDHEAAKRSRQGEATSSGEKRKRAIKDDGAGGDHTKQTADSKTKKKARMSILASSDEEGEEEPDSRGAKRTSATPALVTLGKSSSSHKTKKSSSGSSDEANGEEVEYFYQDDEPVFFTPSAAQSQTGHGSVSAGSLSRSNKKASQKEKKVSNELSASSSSKISGLTDASTSHSSRNTSGNIQPNGFTTTSSSANPSQTSQDNLKRGDWACSVCTLINTSRSKVCKVCETSRWGLGG